MTQKNINIEKHINNFLALRSILENIVSRQGDVSDKNFEIISKAIANSCIDNGFFTEQNIKAALKAIAKMLDEENLINWTDMYSLSKMPDNNCKTIGVVSAGNIPLVGFHDFLCVVFSGNCYLGKLSHQDKHLLPALVDVLIDIDGRYKDYIKFSYDKINQFDAIIATGSSNTERYFEYYFKKYPHIIRRNRNSVAILNGKESINELRGLADDMFMYFGLGCRNVSKIFVPHGYDFSLLINASEKYSEYTHHNKFRNNYDYYKTIFLMNNQAFVDAGFYILKENYSLNNPVSVFHYEFYTEISEVQKFIEANKDNLQCVVGNIPEIDDCLGFGSAQNPQLWDYADNIDTMKFLIDINS